MGSHFNGIMGDAQVIKKEENTSLKHFALTRLLKRQNIYTELSFVTFIELGIYLLLMSNFIHFFSFFIVIKCAAVE